MPPLVVDFNYDSYESPEVHSHVQMINDLFQVFQIGANEKTSLWLLKDLLGVGWSL